MTRHTEARGSSDAAVRARQLWTLAALLCVFTLGVAQAARLGEGPTHSGPVDPGELVRHATQDRLAFEGRLDRGAVHVGGNGEVHLELVARGFEAEERRLLRRPTDVVVVLDRSGSMQGAPLANAQAAIRELVGQLGVRDRFALVTYSNGAELVIPLAEASDAARRRFADRIGSIHADGGTNMAAGLDRAHSLLSESRLSGRMARVVLLSDGHANQGDATPEGLSRRSARAVSGEYVLSTVGVGEGFDERLMTRLADAGTGNFYYVPNVEVLAGIFEAEFAAARDTVASALEIRIDTPSGIEVLDAAGYPLERGADYAVLRPGALFAGQTRSFWVTLRVPAATPGRVDLGAVRLAYTPAEGGARRELRLPSLRAIDAVRDESTFVASLDKEAVATHHAEETVNRLRQTVSELVSRGDYGGARDELEEVDFDELRALGVDDESTASFAEIESIKREVDAAAAAPSAVQSKVRSQLGKKLYEAGTDGRRKGAKR